LKLNKVIWVALMLLVVGGLNWGLVGLYKFDLVCKRRSKIAAGGALKTRHLLPTYSMTLSVSIAFYLALG
jgi:hypothetical protein